MSWLDDAKRGLLKGLDALGRIRLYRNDGVALPIAQVPVTEIDHNQLTNYEAERHINWKDASDAFKTSNSAEFDDCIQNGHKNNQEFMVNVFQYPNPGTDWTPTITGAYLSGFMSNKVCWIPLNFLKIGDEIVSYKLVGDAVVVDAIQLNCKLVRVNKADPLTTSDITGGAISTVSVDGNFDSLATLSSVETVATDKQYLLQLTGSSINAGDKIYVMGAEVKINRK